MGVNQSMSLQGVGQGSLDLAETGSVPERASERSGLWFPWEWGQEVSVRGL